MSNETRSLKGKVARVTGGARGIGRYIALRMAEAGADVAVGLASGIEAAEESAAACRKLGVKAVPAAADLCDAEQVEAMVARVRSDLGPLSVVIHNACPPRAEFFDTRHTQCENIFAPTYYGVWSCVHAYHNL